MDTEPSFFVEVRDGDGAVTRYPIEAGTPAVAGRAADARVRLDGGMVSRHHARFDVDPVTRRVRVTDLGSRNGTLVDGVRVTERWLDPGQRVSIGPFELAVTDARGTGVEPAPSPGTTSTRVIDVSDVPVRLTTLREHAAPRVDAAHLTALMDLGEALLAEPDETARLCHLCDLMVDPRFQGKWAAVVRTAIAAKAGAGAAPEPVPEILCDSAAPGGEVNPYLSRGVLRRVRETGDPVLAANVGVPAANVDVEMSIAPGVSALAAVACPLSRTDAHVQLLYVMLPPSHGSAEWLALASLAVRQHQQAESAWAERRRAEASAAIGRELERARQIQMRLVPRDAAFPRLDVAVGFAPCRQVGGDYVDALRLADGRVLLAVADVCGKGLPAALVASSVHTMVRAAAFGGLPPTVLMEHLNRYLCQTLSAETFVTAAVVAVDPETGAAELVSAGHPPPILLRPGGAARRLELSEPNLPLGIEESPMTSASFELRPGDTLVLYTDGLTELADAEGQELGIEGLMGQLDRAAAASADASSAGATSDLLTAGLNDRLGGREPADDRTFLVARRT